MKGIVAMSCLWITFSFSQMQAQCLTGNCQNGIGKYKFKSGAVYEGSFRNGRMNGQGKCYFSDRSIYDGEWKLGRKEGKGKLTKPNGSYYIGGFQFNTMHGQGSIHFMNGDQFSSYWENGKAKGKGIYTYESGKIEEGSWVEGRFKAAYKEVSNPVQDQSKVRPSSTRITQQPFGNKVEIFALIVGVARYTSFEALKYTDDDAYRIYAFLKSPEGGAVHDDNIRLLIDESAISKNINRSLDEVIAMADENDVIITYFAGHGLNGAYLPYDCNGYENKLEYQDIKDKLAVARAKQKLCIVDACYSGSLLAMKAPMMESLNLFYNEISSSEGGTAFLVSSKEEEYSLESRGLRQGIFSHFLIEGLKGNADKNQNKIVTINELYNFVYSNVRDYSGAIQNPILAGRFDKEMPIGLVR